MVQEIMIQDNSKFKIHLVDSKYGLKINYSLQNSSSRNWGTGNSGSENYESGQISFGNVCFVNLNCKNWLFRFKLLFKNSNSGN